MSRREHANKDRANVPSRGAGEAVQRSEDADGAHEPPAQEGGDQPGVRHDPALQAADRLPRLGNEEEKPSDDRFGE